MIILPVVMQKFKITLGQGNGRIDPVSCCLVLHDVGFKGNLVVMNLVSFCLALYDIRVQGDICVMDLVSFCLLYNGTAVPCMILLPFLASYSHLVQLLLLA